MNVSRNFLVTGPLFLLVGVFLGMYMGATQDHSLAPVHAHLNLLGFVLMMVFGLTYNAFPAAGTSSLARIHFWLHLVGAVVLLAMIMLLFTGQITETAMFPLAPLAELCVLVGVVIFALNMFRHAR